MSEMERAHYSSLAGRRVVVTGGGSGIGAAIVAAFVGQNCDVHFLDVQKTESRELVEFLSQEARPPTFHHCDLTDPNAVASAFETIGAVDILVNNAGNDDRHMLEDVTAEYFDERIAVNLRHCVLCTRAVVREMKACGRGVIVNLGSIAWRVGLPNMSVYEASKAAIEGVTRALSRELGPAGIRVVCVAPGSVATPRQLKWYPPGDAEAEILQNQSLKRRIEPRDVAAFILFLSSDSARCCTGQTYLVDAGWA